MPAYAFHGYEMVNYLENAIRKHNTRSDLIIISATDLYLETGTKSPILHGKCPQYLTSNTWLQKIWEFANECNIDITIPKFPKIPEQRADDAFIMNLLPPHMTKKQLIQVNKCRMYTKALIFSDITHYNGRSILPQFLEGNSQCKSVLSCPALPKPSKPA